MNTTNHKTGKYGITIATVLLTTLFMTILAMAGDYPALQNVKKVKTVFDVSQGSPQLANIVFWAVKNVYEDPSVRSLPEPPQIAVVFHGPAVKMISTDRKDFKAKDANALDDFAKTIRQMKADGVKIEACDYAMKVLNVDPATILPEVDRVDNGFISIAGYQAQGYSLITIN